MRAIAACITLAVFTTVACDSSSKDKYGYVPSMASAIEGLPVPSVAQRVDANLEPTGARRLRTETYRVPGMDFQKLKAWYDKHLPAGQPWRQSQWCGLEEGKMYLGRDYYDPASRAFLGVTITRDEPPGIVVGADQDASPGC